VRAEPLRLLVIGNSFSRNATQYLPELAKAGGHDLIIGKAELSGARLSQHWEAVEAAEANPEDPKGKPYGRKSLRTILSQDKWDIVTIQQASTISGNIDTYRPYARNLYQFIKTLCPQATVIFHETWAYRSDSAYFTTIDGTIRAKSQQAMWQYVHHAYYSMACELNLGVIPDGDAFWKIDNDPRWGYQRDPHFDFAHPVEPVLPDQTHSLHVGYYWSKGRLRFDTHHASAAGCYLGALVWYGFLFRQSPEKLSFVPAEVPADFATHLRKVAWQVVKANKRPLRH